MCDRWTDQLSDYLDDDLARADRAALERHLEACAECRRTLEELRLVKSHAAALVDPPSPNDLWAGIASRIGTAGTSSADPALHEPGRILELPRRTRRGLAAMVHLTVPQLAAAGIALLLVSAAALWLGTHPGAVRRAQQVATGRSPAPAQVEASYATFDADHVDDEIAQLRLSLQKGRGKLSPETIAVLEKSLKAIEEATADARSALARDPANRDLQEYFTGTVQRKIDMVKRATALAGV